MEKMSNFYKQFVALHNENNANNTLPVVNGNTACVEATEIEDNSNEKVLGPNNYASYESLPKIKSTNNSVNNNFMELLSIFSSALGMQEVVDDSIIRLSEDEVEVIGVNPNVSQLNFNEDQFSVINKRKNSSSINSKVKDFKGLILSEENLPMKKSDRFNCNIEALELLTSIAPGDNISRKQAIILSKFSGWGGLGDYFKESHPRNQELQKLLGENYDKARTSVLTSYYTPSNVIKICYEVLKRIGFKKGKILECSAGTGRFLTYMSRNMYTTSKIHCVEIDPTSSKILSLLHPKSKVHSCGFEETEFEDDDFDLVISNIPFGDIPVYDKKQKDLNKHNFRIHDYFFAKALKKVRVGGIIAFITSSGFLDKENTNVRKYISKEAELLGVVRLPNDTFAGTNVVSDIVFLKKTETSTSECDWLEIKPLSRFEDKFSLNECFFHGMSRLGYILGDLDVISSPFGDKLTVYRTSDYESTLKNFIKSFKKESYHPRVDESYLYEEDEVIDDLEELLSNAKPWMKDIRLTEYVILNGELYQKQLNSFAKPILSESVYPIVYQYAVIKEIVYDIRTNPDISDNDLSILQKRLNEEFDYFVSKFGHANTPKIKKALSEDKVGYNLFSTLEKVNQVFDEDKNELVTVYIKSDIFSKRIVGKSHKQRKPETLEEAIVLSFWNKKELDLEFISDVMEMNYKDVVMQCLEKKIVYYNFMDGRFEDDSEYLSGYTVDKLKHCEMLLDKISCRSSVVTVVKEDEIFLLDDLKSEYVKKMLEIAIEGLRENQPDFVTNIDFTFSSTWIPEDVKLNFIIKTLGIEENKYNKLAYIPNYGYEIDICSYIDRSVNYTEWGTEKVPAERIIKYALNDATPKVTYVCDDKTYVDTEATQMAISMVKKWNDAFKSYVAESEDLYAELVDLYNKKFVRIKEKQQRNFILNPETNPEIQLRPHQLKGVSRILSSRHSILLNHEVGTGKTYTMDCASHQLHKISILKGDKPHKTLHIVPNHLIMSGQSAREYLNLYPNANILALTPDDLKMENRRRTLNLIAYNNFEAVFIPYSVLELIPLKRETLERLYDEDMSELNEAIAKANEADVSIYKIEKQIESQKRVLDKLLDCHKDDLGVYFEDLGFDTIMVDEAHNFKSLYFYTSKSRVAGVSTSQSMRATNLYNIVRYMRETKGPSSIVFSTATPITNSLSEMYNFTRYLAPELLQEHGVSTFDEWSSVFGQIVTDVESDVTGRNFKLKPRFAKFFNTPELITMFKQFADVVFTEDIQDIVVPKIAGGKPTIVEVEPTEDMIEYIDDLVDRVKAFESKNNKEDNMLKICGDGRNLSVSPQLVGIDQDSPKAVSSAEKIFEIYEKYPDGTQVVFCDLGVPGKEYSIYTEIKDLLIDKGVPENEIAFIHDCGSSPQERNLMINKFNDGVIKILFGSTPLLGEGANIQCRLKALHHLDCPWVPSSLRQREGRIIRFGNKNKEVYIFRYVLKNSFDVFSWQTVERKAKFISQISTGSKDIREIADFSDDSIDYATAKAAASGNPLIIEQATLNNRVAELKLLEKNFMASKYRNKKQVDDLKIKVEKLEYSLTILEKEVQIVNENKSYLVELETPNMKYSGIDQVCEYLKETKYYNDDYSCFGVSVKFDYNNDRISIGKSGRVNSHRYIAPGRIYQLLLSIPDMVNEAFDKSSKLINRYTKDIESMEAFLKKDFEYKEELRNATNRLAEIELLMSKKPNNE